MNQRGGIIQRSSRRESALASHEFLRDVSRRLKPAATKMKRLLQPTLPLAIVSVCLFGYVLNTHSGIFREYQEALLQEQWILLVCLAVWFGTFILLAFGLNDLSLIGLLLIAIGGYFMSQTTNRPATDAIILLAGMTLGKGARFMLRLKAEGQRLKEGKENIPEFSIQHLELRVFLFGLVLLLAFGSLWHLDVAQNFYPGTRWTGLWDNPNTYGMLMGAGVTLTIGILAERLKAKGQRLNREPGVSGQQSVVSNQNKLLRFLRSFADKMLVGDSRSLSLRILLFVAALMMGTGLIFSYSRGAWLATGIGLLYLAKAYRKFKWRSPKVFVLSAFCLLLLLVGVWFFWNNTPENASWMEKRLDLGRASAQHRVAAWRGALQMMRDHPFGVSWNKTIETYQRNYSPPEGGAAAITTNDYLMLGTQLGWPGLVCFVAYVGLCFRGRARHSVRAAAGLGSAALLRGIGRGAPRPYPGVQGTADPTLSPAVCSVVVPTAGCGGVSPPAETPGGPPGQPAGETPALRCACRAGALVMLVAFWFDGGLFKLATASVFWILLELGSERQKLKTETLKAESGRQFRHFTPALSPNEAEREPKLAIGNPKANPPVPPGPNWVDGTFSSAPPWNSLIAEDPVGCATNPFYLGVQGATGGNPVVTLRGSIGP
jgi:hypothetical protein